ncbi:DUF805 domain-containing protein [Tropicimonas isoalkanivorans]|uniref:Uncharacterized membrane protein YhaH, DUF805 family n=1 Tax=Tropicimonas isoalkanivorans TaxID=441112 RepID=A0A1I1N5Z6_9RHOB|nr:DUF805 domain-containing protein [Tropicimonas isoalkanivorans]SFC93087.1 Uncharacterized membrane protein YhaH, DUF805 family [Tropicimonas isoalkanivorans]
MTFQEAVRTCIQKYVQFSGRARRPEYWWFALFNFLGSIISQMIDRLLFGPDVGVLAAIWGLALLLPSIAVGVRRLHDLEKSGWWLLIALIPIIGFLVLLYWFVQKGTEGPNRFGPEPRMVGDASPRV